MTDVFDPGDRVRLTRTFTAIDSSAIVAVSVACTVLDPAGATQAVTLTTTVTSPSATATGYFTIPAANTSAGWWYARWVASGDIVAADEDTFYVRQNEVL